MHYICTGECGGVAGEEGVCNAEVCSKKGMPLEPCECTDGKHGKKEEGASEVEDNEGIE